MENETKKISSYIRDILSGKPIVEIPRDFILKVHEAFVKNKAKYNIRDSKYIQIIQEFNSVEKRFRLNRKEFQNNHIIGIQQSVINNELDDSKIKPQEIDVMVEGLINGLPFENIQTESINSIIDFNKQKINQLVKDGELNKASDHQKLNDDMIQLSYERKYLSTMNAKKEGISNQISIFQQKIDEEKEKINNENKKIDQETYYLIQLEEEEWAKFLLQFDIETDQGPSPKYLKLSSKLLNLKQVEKSLIRSKRFKEAAKIHEVSSQLEEKELNNQYNIFINERKNKKSQLALLHKTRIECIQSNAERKKAAFEKKCQVTIDSLNNAIRNILIKEKDINNLISEESKIQNDEANSNINKTISHVQKKKKKVSSKPKQAGKNVKRVHFDESIFQ